MQAIPPLPVKPMSDIESWLERHDLHEFAGAFSAEQIRLTDLPTLTDEDLKELGLPMGPRRRLLRAAADIGKLPIPREDVPAADESGSLTGEAERRQLSVMFCDLVGSVELGERMDVEDYRDLLARFRIAVQSAIEQFDGFVARHQGDGLLAYFGYPQAHENDAERAVRAALRVIADVQAIRHPYPVTLEVRVGIATGPVIVGDVLATGASRRSELAALGPTPNLAARLQAIAAPNAVVVSTTTRRLVEHFFSLRRLAPQTLKGIAAPVHSYVVQGALDPETGSAALDSSAGLNPFVGRQGELRLMLERWNQVKEGSGQGVLISAEPGVGKTRLVREIREALAPPDYASIVLFCSPYHGGTTLYPVIEAINRRLGSRGDDTDMSRFERLESWLGELGLDPGVHLPTIASLLSLPPSAKYPSLDANPDVRRDLLLRSLRQLVEKLAERQPVLLVAEDLHWADASTIELLGLLLDDARSRPILALLTFRPEFEPPWKRLSNLTSLTLNNLTDVECRTLARQVFGQGSTNESVLEQVVARADGVPLFAEELARAVLESSSSGEATGSIPETLRDALTARLDRLGRVKEVAQLAAIIGREFSLFPLMHLSGLEEASLRTALDALVASGLIYPRGSGDRYEFKHALVQEAAYGSLLRERRQACHRQLAEILEQHAPDVGENQPELLARHYEEGGVMESALDYWYRAGRRAGEQSAHSESVDHLRRALALLGDLPATPERRELALELNILLGAALQMVVGQTAAEVETTYQRARILAAEVQHPERSWPVVFGLWRWHVTNGDRSTAERIQRELSALSRQVEDPDLACSTALASGITAFYTGRFVEAWEHLGPVLESSHFLMLRVGMPVEASASVYRALTLWQLGFQEQALQWVALKSDRPYQRMIVLHFAALLHSFAQDVGKVRECAEEGHKLALEQGFPWFFNMGMFLRGWALAHDGELEAGVSMMEEYLQRYPEERSPPRMSHVFSMLSEAYEVNGQVSEALRANRTAREIAERDGWRFWYAEILRREGELLLRASDADADEAFALFEKALGTAQAQGSRSLALRAAVSIAQLHRDRGRRTDAIEVLSPVYGQFTEGFAGKDLTAARRLLAELR